MMCGFAGRTCFYLFSSRHGYSIDSKKHNPDTRISRVWKKPVFEVSEKVLHNPGYTATEDGKTFEISGLEKRRIVVSM